jgi:hypothetical protein
MNLQCIFTNEGVASTPCATASRAAAKRASGAIEGWAGGGLWSQGS